MSSKVRIVKKQKADELIPNQTADVVKTEHQRNREIVGVIKSWIHDFKINSNSRSQAALALLAK